MVALSRSAELFLKENLEETFGGALCIDGVR